MSSSEFSISGYLTKMSLCEHHLKQIANSPSKTLNSMQSTVNSLHSLLLRTGSFRDTETVLWFSQREISDAYNLVNGNTSETSLWSFKRTFARFSVVQHSFCIANIASKTGNCTSVLSSGLFWVCYVLMTQATVSCLTALLQIKCEKDILSGCCWLKLPQVEVGRLTNTAGLVT